jgi:hypothetical protein
MHVMIVFCSGGSSFPRFITAAYDCEGEPYRLAARSGVSPGPASVYVH